MTASDGLLAAELPPVSYDEWRRRVEDELGGVSVESELAKAVPGLPAHRPIYSGADLFSEGREPGGEPSGFPGLPPYTRGAAPIRRGWQVAQEIRGEEEARVLEEEAEVDVVWVDPGAPSLERILFRLDLSRRRVFLGSGTGIAAAKLVAEADRQGVARERLRGGFGCDPLGVLARRSALPESLDRAFELAAGLTAWTLEEAPGSRALLVDLGPYHDAGAGAVEELALLAASGVEVLRRLTEARGGLDAETVSRQLHFAVAVGGDVFLEIAKLRAARLLWAKVARACGASSEAQALRLHARTSAVCRTIREPRDNLVRETAACFAAAIGGAAAIATAPFDEPSGSPSGAGRRLAVNTQHVLREEAFLGQVLDPAGGSYYVERLTEDLARAAWTLFQEVERRGGTARCLVDGWIAERIAATAEKRRRARDDSDS